MIYLYSLYYLSINSQICQFHILTWFVVVTIRSKNKFLLPLLKADSQNEREHGCQQFKELKNAPI